MEKHFSQFFAQNDEFIITFFIVQRMLGVLVVIGGHPANIGGGYW